MDIDTRRCLQFLSTLPELPTTLSVPSSSDSISIPSVLEALLNAVADISLSIPLAVVATLPKIDDIVDKEALNELRSKSSLTSDDIKKVFGHVTSGNCALDFLYSFPYLF